MMGTPTSSPKTSFIPFLVQRHVPVELRVSGSIHLPHAAFADLGGDSIRAEGRAGLQWHVQFTGTRSVSSWNQFSTKIRPLKRSLSPAWPAAPSVRTMKRFPSGAMSNRRPRPLPTP